MKRPRANPSIDSFCCFLVAELSTIFLPFVLPSSGYIFDIPAIFSELSTIR
jgi:hypothetical protein